MRRAALLLSLALVAGCGDAGSEGADGAPSGTLTVFAAASLTDVFTALGDALEDDHDYLTVGNVFTPDLIETWIDYKRANEIDPIRLRPHPHEFAMYYDI